MTITFPCSVAFGDEKVSLNTVGVRLLNTDGSEHTARTTAGVYEMNGGGYGKNITFPDNWKGILEWDTGEGSPLYAYEDYNYLTMPSGTLGAGGLSCTWAQKDSGNTPMDNVGIWITTDITGTNIIAGTIYTNASGEVIFMLDAGTYYVWREKAGYNFTNPQTWSVD